MLAMTRDLKPANFLIDGTGHLRLADFGLSKKGMKTFLRAPFRGQLPPIRRLSSNLLSSKKLNKQISYSMVGSPNYMAVEVLTGHGYGFEADWWSLGCILFEMIVGYPPFCASTPLDVFANVMNYKNVLHNPVDETTNQPALTPRCWDLIQRLLCDRSERLGAKHVSEIQNHIFFVQF